MPPVSSDVWETVYLLLFDSAWLRLLCEFHFLCRIDALSSRRLWLIWRRRVQDDSSQQSAAFCIFQRALQSSVQFPSCHCFSRSLRLYVITGRSVCVHKHNLGQVCVCVWMWEWGCQHQQLVILSSCCSLAGHIAAHSAPSVLIPIRHVCINVSFFLLFSP